MTARSPKVETETLRCRSAVISFEGHIAWVPRLRGMLEVERQRSNTLWNQVQPWCAEKCITTICLANVNNSCYSGTTTSGHFAAPPSVTASRSGCKNVKEESSGALASDGTTMSSQCVQDGTAIKAFAVDVTVDAATTRRRSVAKRGG